MSAPGGKAVVPRSLFDGRRGEGTCPAAKRLSRLIRQKLKRAHLWDPYSFGHIPLAPGGLSLPILVFFHSLVFPFLDAIRLAREGKF